MSVELKSIKIDELMPDPNQPRKHFLEEEIQRLAVSIAARGVLMPLRVMWDEERKCWRIITGESRWRAAKLAGLTHVPCLEVQAEVSEADILSEQIIENLVRSDVSPLDAARALVKLKALKNRPAKQIAEELGLNGATFTRAEALLTLPESIQEMIDDGRVSPDAGYQISRHHDPAAQLELAQMVAEKRLSRDGVAERVRKAVGQKRVRLKGTRLAYRMENGVLLSVSAAEPLTWDTLLTALKAARKQADELRNVCKDVTAFGNGA